MNMKNEDLHKSVISDTDLKEIIVNYVGIKTNPENDEVTVENVIDIFAEEFPEFLLAVAEENWINGYTQALNDIKFVENDRTKDTDTNNKIKNRTNDN